MKYEENCLKDLHIFLKCSAAQDIRILRWTVLSDALPYTDLVALMIGSWTVE
jgi:hypothetical protein